MTELNTQASTIRTTIGPKRKMERRQKREKDSETSIKQRQSSPKKEVVFILEDKSPNNESDKIDSFKVVDNFIKIVKVKDLAAAKEDNHKKCTKLVIKKSAKTVEQVIGDHKIDGDKLDNNTTIISLEKNIDDDCAAAKVKKRLMKRNIDFLLPITTDIQKTRSKTKTVKKRNIRSSCNEFGSKKEKGKKP